MSTTTQPGAQKPSKLLIQMSGVPGSGKSTIARLLQESIGGIVIDHDVYRSALLEDSDRAFDDVARSAYRVQWAMAREMMKQGFNVIIDSTCNYQVVLDQGRAAADRYGFAYWYVECKVEDIDLLDERLRKREPMKSQRVGVDCPPEAAISARAGQDPRALFKTRIKNRLRPEHNAIVVDSTEDPEKNRDYILQRDSGEPGV